MTSKPDSGGDEADLRARAERIACEDAVLTPQHIEALSPEETRRLVHDLRVHQIELEMQNEELRRAQTELDRLRARYFDLYDLAPVGYCTVSQAGVILEANLAAAKLLGASRGALINQPITTFIHREDQDTYYLHRRQIFEAGGQQAYEIRMVKADSTPFWALMETALARDEDTPVCRVIMSNITTRIEAEEALKGLNAAVENERLRLEAVLEVLPTGVAITDARGGSLQTNEEYGRIWGGPRPVPDSIEDYAAYKAWWAETGEPLAPEEWASARAVREGRPVVGQMLEIQRFDGFHAFVLNSAAPIRDVAGSIVGSAVTIHDITDRWKAEVTIEKLNETLQEHVNAVEAANVELESYSHYVSHDLRTPLRFVNRIAHLLLGRPEEHLSDGAIEQVNMILQATDEMAALIENLLVFSQASRQPIRRRRVNLRNLFQEVLNELQHSERDCSAEVVIRDLAPCQGDRTLLKEVVVNLLANALKFTRRREDARIVVGCTETEAETVYFVQDNGVGFNMGHADALFLPFRRLHSKAEFEGTGIGLALVKRIIERHGGRVWAEGEVDTGATFYFTLEQEPADQSTTS